MASGQRDEALRIRQQDELPVFERFDDVRAVAVTKGGIADILEASGELEDARRREEQQVLPIFERLDDVREIAITKGRIADILLARGQFDEARVLQEERLRINRKHSFPSGTAGALGLGPDRLTARQAARCAPLQAHELVLQLDRTEGIATIGDLFGRLLISGGQRNKGLEVLRRSAPNACWAARACGPEPGGLRY